MADTPEMPTEGSHWRHKRRGSTYQVVTGDAEVQVASGVGIDEGEVVVVYRADSDGTYWVRRRPEFMDGRFEPFTLPVATTPEMPEMVPGPRAEAECLLNIIDRHSREDALTIVTGTLAELWRDGVLAERVRAASEPSASARGLADEAIIDTILKFNGSVEFNVPAALMHDMRDAVATALTAAETAAREAAIRECAEIASQHQRRHIAFQGDFASAILSLLDKPEGETL